MPDDLPPVELALRDARNDLLNIRGILSPADRPTVRVVPMELGEQVAPAVGWVVAEMERLRAEVAQLRAVAELIRSCHDDGREGFCCGQAFPCETVQYLDDASWAGRVASSEKAVAS